MELAEEAMENGMSIVLFMNFKDSIDALAERLKTKCIIDGRNKPKERQANIDAFQNDKNVSSSLMLKQGCSISLRS